MTNEDLNKKVHAVRGECFHIPDGNNVDECKKCGYAFQRDNFEPYDCREDNKDYPGNIAHAWELVEEMKKKGYNANSRFAIEYSKEISKHNIPFDSKEAWMEVSVFDAIFKLTPTAICLAYIEVMR